jgi:ribosomal protein S18 acetylase RimI-like enzyme
MSEFDFPAETMGIQSSPTVEKATLGHVPDLRRLWHENFDRFGYGEDRFETMFFDLNTDCLVATDGVVSLGFILFARAGRRAEILGLAVARQSRRHRLGDALVNRCLKTLKGKGARHVSFHTQPENLAAQLLFESYGFRAQGVDGHYPSGEQAVRYVWSVP